MKTILQALIGAAVIAFFAIWAFTEDLAAEINVAYLEQCKQQVAPIPDFSCADGVEIPVTDNGVTITPATFAAQMTCDRPALLFNGKTSDGQCVPGSRILNLSTETRQVSVMCRKKNNRPGAPMLFDEIDVIAHNPASGATCWFQASAPDVNDPIDGTQISSPTTPTEPYIWKAPSDILKEDEYNDGCGDCHDNDPFMYSPFVGQVWDQVPANPFGPYFHVDPEIGFDQWPTTIFDMRDNTCVGCHRIGKDHTCSSLTDWMTGQAIPLGANGLAKEFPLSHAMPPAHGQTFAAWSTFHDRSLAEIKSCCEDPLQQICNATEIPRYPQQE